MLALYITLGILVTLLVIIPLFLPSKAHCERSIAIDAPADKVFEQIISFKNWEKWSPWQDKDPHIQQRYEGNEGEVGHSYSWKGNKKVGQGKIVITSIKKYVHMGFDLQFGKNPKAAPAGFNLSEADKKTKVTWYIDTDFGMFLPGRYFALMFDKMLGPDYEKGLQKLKEVVEKH